MPIFSKVAIVDCAIRSKPSTTDFMLSLDLTSSEILDFALSILSLILIISFAKLAIPYLSASD